MSKPKQHTISHRMRWLGSLAVLLVLPLLAACGQNVAQPSLRVVATITPLGDWARQVGESRVTVTQIVPAGVDPATYVLTDADRQALAQADVVLSNGLGLEPWLPDALGGRDPQSFVGMQVSDFVGPLVEGSRITVQSPLAGEDDDPRLPRSTSVNPVYVPDTVYSSYIWLSPAADRAQRAVLYIGDTFTRADPQGVRFYRGNAERYVGELENLHLWIAQQRQQWPKAATASNRPVIQVVDRSWYYFADTYLITLRTLNNGQYTAASSERLSTPLFGNRYMSAAQQARLPRPVDAVLDPFASDDYIEMMKANVEIMAQAVQQAATRTNPVGSVPQKQYEVP
jgi:ABC-type Zn uptake system ZnuABC Zn-binding protein ZnuA